MSRAQQQYNKKVMAERMGAARRAQYASERSKIARKAAYAAARSAAVTQGNQPELKFFDSTPTAPAAGVSTGVVTQMNAMASGATNVTRVGNRIQMKSARVRGKAQYAATTTGDGSVRVMIVLDRRPVDGTPATSSQILETDNIEGFADIANDGRFKILRDETQCLSVNGDRVVHFDLYCTMDERTSFTTTAANSVKEGEILCVIYASTFAIASLTTDFHARVRYVDV